MPHDFNRFPELRNDQVSLYYPQSPHKQIFSNFRAIVETVKDGDTVQLNWKFRDFLFPLRIRDIDTPELNAPGGLEAKMFLKELIEGQEVMIMIDPKKRTEKWGRLLGDIFFRGMRISELMKIRGHAVDFEKRGRGRIPSQEELARL